MREFGKRQKHDCFKKDCDCKEKCNCSLNVRNVGNPVVNVNVNTPNGGGFQPSYGNFWWTGEDGQGAAVPVNDPIPFTNTGPTAGGVFLLNPTTIRIEQGGVYNVSYIVTANLAQSGSTNAILSLRLNNMIVPNNQTTFGVAENDTCVQVSGQAILSIPSNSTLQLVNTDPDAPNTLFPCDATVNNAAINIIKLSQ